MSSKPTSVRLQPQQERDLKKIGERDERSLSWLIKRAVDEYISRNLSTEMEGRDAG